RLLHSTYRRRVGRQFIDVRIGPDGLDRFLFPVRLRHFRVERFQLRTHRILLCSWRCTILSASGTGMIHIVLGGPAMSTAPRASMVQLTASPDQPVRPRTRLRPGRGLGALYRRITDGLSCGLGSLCQRCCPADVRPDTAVGAAPSAAETKRTPKSWRMDSA